MFIILLKSENIVLAQYYFLVYGPFSNVTHCPQSILHIAFLKIVIKI